MRSRENIKCYLLWNGSCHRFYPRDIVDLLPNLFAKQSTETTAWINDLRNREMSSAKQTSHNDKIPTDSAFESFYRSVHQLHESEFPEYFPLGRGGIIEIDTEWFLKEKPSDNMTTATVSATAIASSPTSPARVVLARADEVRSLDIVTRLLQAYHDPTLQADEDKLVALSERDYPSILSAYRHIIEKHDAAAIVSSASASLSTKRSSRETSVIPSMSYRQRVQAVGLSAADMN